MRWQQFPNWRTDSTVCTEIIASSFAETDTPVLKLVWKCEGPGVAHRDPSQPRPLQETGQLTRNRHLARFCWVMSRLAQHSAGAVVGPLSGCRLPPSTRACAERALPVPSCTGCTLRTSRLLQAPLQALLPGVGDPHWVMGASGRCSPFPSPTDTVCFLPVQV